MSTRMSPVMFPECATGPAGAPALADWLHQDWSTFRDWPQALGAWHWQNVGLSNNLPSVSLFNGAAWPLVRCHLMCVWQGMGWFQMVSQPSRD